MCDVFAEAVADGPGAALRAWREGDPLGAPLILGEGEGVHRPRSRRRQRVAGS